MKVNKYTQTDFSMMKYDQIKALTQTLKAKNTNASKEALKDIASILKTDTRKNINLLSKSLFKYILKVNNEFERVRKLYAFDKSFGNFTYVAGTDEVGRGPLAGPIVGASVILNSTSELQYIMGINDSKKLSAFKREELATIIKERCICFNIYELDNKEIDNKGISWCNNEVLKNSSTNLSVKPELVLSDGYPIRNIQFKNEFVIKGDTKSAAIGAASILAKVYRDQLMNEYSLVYPQYGFERNAGYGTSQHIAAVKKYGPCPVHRNSFLRGILNSNF
jgi:ribonuclease HII